MKQTEVTIYRAVDAFLYLPTYIAEYEGIFGTIRPDLAVNFVTANGDIDAINKMLDDEKSGSNIPLALCDPVSAFSKMVDLKEHGRLRVIAAIIDKPPFWAVNGIKDTLTDAAAFRNRFKRLIYYGENLITGHFLGT